MSVGAIRAGRAEVELAIKNELAKGLSLAAGQLQNFASGVKNIGLAFTAIGGAASAFFVKSINDFAKHGDELEKMSIRTGIAVESLSNLDLAAKLSDLSLNDLEKSIRKMQKTISGAKEKLGEVSGVLGKLGIEAIALQGLPVESQFAAIADALGRIPDPTLRAALAMSVFGRSGAQILPLIDKGTEGIEKLIEVNKLLGLTMGSDAAKQAVVLHDRLSILKAVLDRVSVVIGEVLTPKIIRFVDYAIAAVSGVKEWIENNKTLIVVVGSVALAVAAAGAIILGMAGAAFFLSSAITGISTALITLGAVIGAILKNKELIASAAVAATILAVALSKTSSVSQWFDQFETGAAKARKALGLLSDDVHDVDDELKAFFGFGGFDIEAISRGNGNVASLAQKTSAAGTFNPFAVQGLGDDTIQRGILDSVKRIANNTDGLGKSMSGLSQEFD